MNPPIELILDLRRVSGRPSTPEELIRLWSTVERSLIGRRLQTGEHYPIDFPEHGTLGLEIVKSPAASELVTDRTVFAIHSILEPSAITPKCRTCAEQSVEEYGPFVCEYCRQGGKASGICLKHAEILEGGLRKGGWIVATCPQHVPTCKACTNRGAFWCMGPDCRGKISWCAAHRKCHVNSPEVGYCAGCYERLFPQCVRPNCREPGTNICEYVASDGTSCGRKLCNRHVARWQVYGYERIGLGRCDQHRNIKDLADPDILWQIVAGTVVRNGKGNRTFYRLPTLGSVKNILLKGRRQFYSEEIARNLYEQLRAKLRLESTRSSVHMEMLRLLDRSSTEWTARVAAAQDRNRDGLVYLARLKAALTRQGLSDIAIQVEMTSFIPNFIKGPTPRPCLFVKLPQSEIGRFVGRNGSRKELLSQAAGCEIRLEKGL